MNTKELEAGMIASGKNRRQRLEIVYGLLSNTHDLAGELADVLCRALPAIEAREGMSDEDDAIFDDAKAVLAKVSS